MIVLLPSHPLPWQPTDQRRRARVTTCLLLMLMKKDTDGDGVEIIVHALVVPCSLHETSSKHRQC